MNLYWPVYKNLESELGRIMYDIHIDDAQLNVYSTRIGDLIVRASTEIESISKSIYKTYGGVKTSNLKYDYDCLEHLDNELNIGSKIIIISSVNCFQTNRLLRPFAKTVKRSGTNKDTYSWNNAYQNIKHNRAETIKEGCLKYLFDAMGALFLLNIYFKDEVFDIGKQDSEMNFPQNQGSEIFSVKLYTGSAGVQADGGFHRTEDYPEFVFRMKATDATYEIALKANQEMNERKAQLFIDHLSAKIQEDPSNLNRTPEELQDWIKQESQKTFSELLIKAMGDPREHAQKMLQLEYQAVIIKENIS